MSYWVSIWLRDDAELWSQNMTSNVACMWREAGVDFRDFRGEPTYTLLPVLNLAISEMKAYPDKYKAMNPKNGWGNYEAALEFMECVRDACIKFKDETVMVSY